MAEISTDDVPPVWDDRYDNEITDSAGYMPCGCHGSQREHTCDAREDFDY